LNPIGTLSQHGYSRPRMGAKIRPDSLVFPQNIKQLAPRTTCQFCDAAHILSENNASEARPRHTQSCLTEVAQTAVDTVTGAIADL